MSGCRRTGSRAALPFGWLLDGLTCASAGLVRRSSGPERGPRLWTGSASKGDGPMAAFTRWRASCDRCEVAEWVSDE
jgi:hypothetical protein